jgi:hypothetical protein
MIRELYKPYKIIGTSETCIFEQLKVNRRSVSSRTRSPNWSNFISPLSLSRSSFVILDADDDYDDNYGNHD